MFVSVFPKNSLEFDARFKFIEVNWNNVVSPG